MASENINPSITRHHTVEKCPCCGPGHLCDSETKLPPCIDSEGFDRILHVVIPISNVIGFERRYTLFRKSILHLRSLPGMKIYVVEVSLGDRPQMFRELEGVTYVGLRTKDVLWHKENMINCCVAKAFPPRWKYMAWIDGDIEFMNTAISNETINQLQIYEFVQMFETAIDLGPNGQAINTRTSFGAQAARGVRFAGRPKYSYYGQPGFAWACTRTAFNAIGGLPDFCILGAGDYHLAMALIGEAALTVKNGMHPNYRKKVMELQKRCAEEVGLKLGYVRGTIIHGWHGRFTDRRYNERWTYLTARNGVENTAFDPDLDIKKDWQGLYIWDCREKPWLVKGVIEYFALRNEDTIDLRGED